VDNIFLDIMCTYEDIWLKVFGLSFSPFTFLGSTEMATENVSEFISILH
jgi:hypothetical protein